MNEIQTIQELLEQRAMIYRFLSRLYRTEIDLKLWRSLRQIEFPEASGNAEIDAGYDLMRGYLAHNSESALTDLAVDFARVFLGAGLGKGDGAYPYASVYTSSKHVLMDKARDRAVAAYAAAGLAKDPKTGDFPEDHLALLLEFMALYCEQAAIAWDKADESAFGDILHKQLSFLQDNLLNWIDAFGQDLKALAKTSFYLGVGKLTCGWIRLDAATLENWRRCEIWAMN